MSKNVEENKKDVKNVYKCQKMSDLSKKNVKKY